MSVQVRLSDLHNMNAAEREKVLSALVEATRDSRPVAQSVLNAQIREYELRYEKSSAQFLAEWGEGKIEETAEIAQWLLLLESRDAIVSR